MNQKYLLSGILLTSTLSAIGCGGGGKSFMTPAQAQASYSDVLAAFSNGVGAAGLVHSAPFSRLRSAEAAAVGRAILNGNQVSLWRDPISSDLRVLPDTNLSSYTYKCPSGGTIVTTGSYTDTASSASLNIVETINKCSDSGVVFSGDPNVALSETASDNGTTTSVSLTLTGGISDGTSSCSINVGASASVSDKTGSGSITAKGSFCGQSINASEPLSL
jgi:hypothetical protein